MIAEGAKAPDFTALDDAGERFTLSGRGGIVVLHFFAVAWTGV